METFTRLFGSLLVFVYHCFDRVVINGYLSGLSRPGQVVHFFQNVLGEPVIGKEVLSRRTNEYQAWVEAFARNHGIAIEWAEPKARKEDYVRPALRRMERAHRHGVYFILKSMEQGQTFRSTVPRFATNDPNYRILARQRSRFTHYYFYIRDEVLGPMVMRAASFFPFQTTYYLNGHNFIEKELGREKVGFRKNDNAFLAVSDPQALQAAADRFTSEVIRKRLEYWTLILGAKFSKRERAAMNLRHFYAVSQIEYCRNFIFKRNFPIHRIFERGCEIGLWRTTANKIAEVFGQRVTKRLKGKLNTVVEQIEHGHHIFRAYYRNAFIKQYEKFSTYLRNEACSNNLADFGLRKSLDNLAAVREKLLAVTDRFAAFQAQLLNVHVDFPLLQRIALPVIAGSVRYPGIKNSRHPHPPPDGSAAAQQYGGLRLARQTDTPGRTHQLRAFRPNLRVEPASLRSAQAQRAWAPGTRRLPLCLPSHSQRRAGGTPAPALPQTPLRPAGQQLDLTANSKPPITRPIPPSKTSSTCSPQPDVTCSNVEVLRFMNEAVRI